MMSFTSFSRLQTLFPFVLCDPISRAFAVEIPISSTIACTFSQFGHPPDVIFHGDIDIPVELDPTHLFVRMLAAPVNPSDINTIEGRYGTLPELPAIAGSEGVGVVECIGENVRGISVGDWVIPTRHRLGTWCAHTIFDSEDVFRIDAGAIPVEAASSLRINPVSAYRMLHDFVDLQEGDWVVQAGPTSTVGRSVVEICASRGLRTINLIRNRPDADVVAQMLHEIGADIVVTMDELPSLSLRRHQRPLLALNCVGGEHAKNIAKLLAPGGTMVTYGGMSMEPISIGTGAFIFQDIRLRGFWLDSIDDELKADGLARVLELVMEGELMNNPYTRDFDLGDDGSGCLAALEAYYAGGYSQGKILLRMSDIE